MIRRLFLLALLSNFSGCAPDVETDDVLQLSVCPMDVRQEHGCPGQPVADGVETTLVRVCTPVSHERKHDIEATLSLSSGHWVTPTDPTQPTITKVTFGAGPCGDASLIVPTLPGYIRVDANIDTYRQSVWLAVGPAPIDFVTVEPSTAQLPAVADAGMSGTTVNLTVHAGVGLGGKVSDGTTARAMVATKPEGAYAIVYPDIAALDATGGATFTAFVTSAATSISVTVTVTPPTVGDLSSAEQSATITLE